MDLNIPWFLKRSCDFFRKSFSTDTVLLYSLTSFVLSGTDFLNDSNEGNIPKDFDVLESFSVHRRRFKVVSHRLFYLFSTQRFPPWSFPLIARYLASHQQWSMPLALDLELIRLRGSIRIGNHMLGLQDHTHSYHLFIRWWALGRYPKSYPFNFDNNWFDNHSNYFLKLG